MPKKGENIYKRKDGRWEGRYIKTYDPCGKAQYSSVYGKTYVEVKTLSEILGHTSVNITLNRYVHSSMDVKRTNMERLKL